MTAAYTETPIGTLPSNKFLGHTMCIKDYAGLPQATKSKALKYLLEVYMDDYIALPMPSSKEHLNHVINAVMAGIHDVFPASKADNTDPISLKKLKQQEAMWAVQKNVLGFIFNGKHKTLWLEEPKRDAILVILKGWLRSDRKGL